jgi:hypothetical protein
MGTIWEHKRKMKEREGMGIFLNVEGKDITLIIIIIIIIMNE